MGTVLSRLCLGSSSSPAAPAAAPKGGAGPAAPAAAATVAAEHNTSSASDKKQSEPKRGLHKFQEIVAGQNVTEDDACRGVILAQKTKKYWVDKKKNNCFMLFPRGLSIAWGENPSYWVWQPLGEGSDGDAAGVEVAELKSVCWLEICGKLELSHLTPGGTYEVAFEVRLKQGCAGWHVPVDLRLELPGGRVQERKEKLEEKPREQWLRLVAGDVEAGKGQQDGELVVSLSEHGGHWKRGLLVKGIRITPRE